MVDARAEEDERTLSSSGFRLESKHVAHRGEEFLDGEGEESRLPTPHHNPTKTLHGRFVEWAEGHGKPSLILASRILWYPSLCDFCVTLIR